jgi:competence ComEA-like helix-hairpin-helix protein
VALYTRSELKLLLALATAVLIGLGAREWRARFPDHADHLERFDREPALSAEPAGADDEPPSVARSALSRRPPSREVRPAGGGRAERPDQTGPAHPPELRPLDLNRATAADLARLPGVGTALASRIVADRERAGPFESPEALRRVLGVGPRKLAAIRALVTTGDELSRTRELTAPPIVSDRGQPEREGAGEFPEPVPHTVDPGPEEP